MFGLFKKGDDLASLTQRLANLEQAEAANRSLIRKLNKQADEADRVAGRMASTIADQAEKIRVLTAQVAEHVEAFNKLGEFNEFVAFSDVDTSDQMKTHQCQIAGLFAWKTKVSAELATIKGKL
jgi:uncharacterized coiled-coil protein SlyX